VPRRARRSFSTTSTCFHVFRPSCPRTRHYDFTPSTTVSARSPVRGLSLGSLMVSCGGNSTDRALHPSAYLQAFALLAVITWSAAMSGGLGGVRILRDPGPKALCRLGPVLRLANTPNAHWTKRRVLANYSRGSCGVSVTPQGRMRTTAGTRRSEPAREPWPLARSQPPGMHHFSRSSRRGHHDQGRVAQRDHPHLAQTCADRNGSSRQGAVGATCRGGATARRPPSVGRGCPVCPGTDAAFNASGLSAALAVDSALRPVAPQGASPGGTRANGAHMAVG